MAELRNRRQDKDSYKGGRDRPLNGTTETADPEPSDDSESKSIAKDTLDLKRANGGPLTAQRPPEPDGHAVFKSPFLPFLLIALPILLAYIVAKPESLIALTITDARAYIADRISFGPYYTSRSNEFPTLPTFVDADFEESPVGGIDESLDTWTLLRWQVGEYFRGKEDPVDAGLLNQTIPNPINDPYALLRLHAAFSMERKLSTTQVPISSLSPIAKAILAQDPSRVPRALHPLINNGLADGETVAIWPLKRHLNNLFLRLVMRTCLVSKESLLACRKNIQVADEFGMDITRKLWADGNVAAVRFVRDILGAREGKDKVGRAGRNLTYARFVDNSRKWKAREETCEIPVVTITGLTDIDGFREVRRLIQEGEPVLIRSVGYHLHGGPRLLGTDIGKLVELVEKAEKRARERGEDDDEEEEEDEDEDEEAAEARKQREAENWDKRASKPAAPPPAYTPPAQVTVGSVPYAGYFGLDTKKMGLVEFFKQHVRNDGSLDEVGDAVPYVFEKNKRITRDGLTMLAALINLVFFRQQEQENSIICPVDGGRNGAAESIHFYLGRAGSGAPTHVHADAFNLLVRGWKRWFVHPPLQSLYSRAPATDYFSILSQLPLHPKPLECLQKPGDVVYVPFDWGHAVINEVDQVDVKMRGEREAMINFGFAVEVVNRREVGHGIPEAPGEKKRKVGRGGSGCE